MELWKPIKNYEGLYAVSNTGKIKRLRFINNKTNKSQITDKILQLNNGGYLTVSLSKNGKQKSYLVHRIVADAFMENPKKLKEINHIDGNKCNNNLENLEWCTREHNMREAFKNGLWKSPNKNKFGGNSLKAKKVAMIDKDTNKVLKVFNSIIDGEKYCNSNSSGAISSCCKGKRKLAHGYKWEYIK